MDNEEVYTPSNSKSRRQKTTSERLEDKLRQLDKANKSLAALQNRIKGLQEDIRQLENKRQKEILKEYGMSLTDLEDFLANNKDKIGGDA